MRYYFRLWYRAPMHATVDVSDDTYTIEVFGEQPEGRFIYIWAQEDLFGATFNMGEVDNVDGWEWFEEMPLHRIGNTVAAVIR